MFQFIRRVSGSFLPRPDRPWRDDATSHAPTIGRKRRYSVTEQDNDSTSSTPVKRVKNENDDEQPEAECDSESDGENPVVPPVGKEVKEVTNGVEEVDLQDRDEKDAPSIRPEGVPLPESPSVSPAPESADAEPAQPEVVEEEHADDNDSVSSSVPEDDAEETAAEGPIDTNISAPADRTAPLAIVEPHETPETLEVKA